MRTKIVLYIFFLLASFSVFSLSSCSEETGGYESTVDAQEVRLILNTRSGGSRSAAPESEVKTLRAIVFEVAGSDGNLTYIRQLKNEPYNSTTGIGFSKCDQVRVVLIANEREAWGLNNTSLTIEEIKELAVAYAASDKTEVNITTPIIMFGESDILSGRTDKQTATIMLERNLARVDLNLSCVATEMSALNGGTLKLKSARMHGMAPYAGLQTPVKSWNLSISDYLISTAKEFVENEHVAYTYENGTFTGFTTTKDLSFYVPEHYVTDTKKHTHITISAEYFLAGTTEAIPMEYTIPVGYGITTDKINNGDFTASDLTIERNTIYQMKAKITSLQQLTGISVTVQPWEEENVNGSINNGIYHLNVSDIFPTLEKGEETLVQFWSNMAPSQIRVLPDGTIKETGETFNTNDVFVSLSDEGEAPRATHIEFISDKEWGRLRLRFNEGAVTVGNTYIITLAAGSLRRTISIVATEKLTENNETNN